MKKLIEKVESTYEEIYKDIQQELRTNKAKF